jgi:hypothetical protein
MAHQDALRGTAHTMELIVLLETLQAGENGRILLGLGLLGAEGIIR